MTVAPPSDAPTRHGLPPAAQARRQAARAEPAPHLSQQIALATMRDEEVGTTRSMIRVGRLVGLAATLPLPFLPGSTGLRIAMAATILFALGVGLWLDRRLREPNVPTERMSVVLALTVCPAIFMAVLYFGIFSAAQLFPALSLYFFARREGFRSALALTLLNAVAQAVFAGLVLAGVLHDPGLIRGEQATEVLVTGHVLLQIAFVGAFLLGRGGHKASKDAIANMHKVMLVANQRAALLDEARQDLDRALAIDAPGRYSDQVFGEYRLGNVIGRGGMGEVYEAFHTGSGTVAAVKLLAARELGDTHSVQRFLREVRAVAGLTSKHVVRVFASSGDDAAVPYLVMERLRGHDLAHHLRSGKMAPDALGIMLAQIGAAVEEAWSHGIVHRDLKPNNIFLVEESGAPVWKVLDFGVAALEESSGTLTEGKVVGTPAYMAPEQARGEKVDHRADVYALAAISYRWLTGRPVCSGKDIHNALYQTVHVMPQQPSTFADLPPDVDAALAIGLVKDPADRFATVAELRAALVAALDGRLSEADRERADGILRRHPWGAVRQ